MKASLYCAILSICATQLLAQKPAAAPATQTHSSEIGFSYTLPTDWEVVDMSQSLAAEQQKAQQTAGSDAEKRGVACIQIALTAHHGSPGSMVVAVQLPLACVGAEMTDKDIPGFGTGAAQGIEQGFDVGDPVAGSYSLGSHNVWISRARGFPKGHPELAYTVETVCSLVKKGAVCWMALAADDAALATFEHGLVTLDGEKPVALVPADAFQKKPS
jgi:hypothetical protein